MGKTAGTTTRSSHSSTDATGALNGVVATEGTVERVIAYENPRYTCSISGKSVSNPREPPFLLSPQPLLSPWATDTGLEASQPSNLHDHALGTEDSYHER